MFSIISTAFFTLYNAVTGIHFKTAWNLSISVYYLLLLLLKMFLILCSDKFHVSEQRMRITYILSFVFLLLLDLSLISPVILLVHNSKTIHADKIGSIAIATFVFSRLVVSVVNLRKGNSKENPWRSQLKMVSFTSSIVSLIVLENTLINVNGSMEGSIYIISFVTTFGLLTMLFFITVLSFAKNLRDISRFGHQ